MAAAYANYADLIVRYDEQTVKDLLSDTGTPVADLSADTKLPILFREASGRINAAIRVGNNYTDDQMTTFIAEALADDGESDVEGDEGPAAMAIEYLKGIACQIVMAMLMRRRPERYDAGTKLLKEIEENDLEPIRKGLRLFDMDGRASSAATIKGDEITRYDVQRTRPLTYRTRNYFPQRENQLPSGR